MRRWWALPEVGVAPQLPLLAQFQRLVELQDSTRVLLDLGQQHHSPPDQPFAELKETLETWRLRAPNGWERLGAWADVLLWRNAVYNIVINAFKSYAETAPHLHQLGYRDKAWSVNRLARIARHQGCPEACKAAIGLLYGFNAMEVQEAFTKTTEQAKAFLLQARPPPARGTAPVRARISKKTLARGRAARARSRSSWAAGATCWRRRTWTTTRPTTRRSCSACARCSTRAWASPRSPTPALRPRSRSGRSWPTAGCPGAHSATRRPRPAGLRPAPGWRAPWWPTCRCARPPGPQRPAAPAAPAAR